MNGQTWIRRLFFRNKGLKILSLLLAGLVWYAIRGVIGITTTVHDIPVMVSVRDGMAVVSVSPEKVSVDFQGSQEELLQLEDAKVRAQLQAAIYSRKRATPGSETIPVHPGDIEGVKSGVRVMKIRPSSVTVDFDYEMEKQVPVRSDISGIPVAGRLVSAVCSPAAVRVRGPRSRLTGLALLITEETDVSQVSESFARKVRIVPPDGASALRVDPASVTLNVVLEREAGVKKFADIPVSALVRPDRAMGIEISPSKVNVSVTGNRPALDRIAQSDLKATADCCGLQPDTPYDIAVGLSLPGVADVSMVADPPSVRVFVRAVK